MSPLRVPLRLPCGAALPNRIAKAAMSEQLGDERHAPTPALERLYARWARGGAGLLITGNVMVDRRALGEPGNVAVEDERDFEGLAAWARSARPVPIWMQINHPGRQAGRIRGTHPVAPSVVPLEGVGPAFAPPRALSEPEIREIIRRFATTASVAARAGFSGVQIHAAHGYLISQFLSPRSNLRTDGWGGSPERRRRFLLEILRAVRAAVGSNFAVGLKLNSADFQRGGFTAEESVDTVRALNEESVDLLEISGGTYERPAMWSLFPHAHSTRAREAYFLEYAERVRATARMPLMLTGGFRTAEAMRAAVAGGAIDVVGLARPMAIEPDFPARVLSGTSRASRGLSAGFTLAPLQAAAIGLWYQWQIERMGRGLAPSPSAGLRVAVVGAIRTFHRSVCKEKP